MDSGHNPISSTHVHPMPNDEVREALPVQPQAHIRRPPNPFIVWSSRKRKIIAKENPKMHNSEISKQLGMEWKKLSPEEKRVFVDKSNQLREEHKQRYPQYKYRPKKKTSKNKPLKVKSSSLNPLPPFTCIQPTATNQTNYLSYPHNYDILPDYYIPSPTLPAPMTLNYPSIQYPQENLLLPSTSNTDPSLDPGLEFFYNNTIP